MAKFVLDGVENIGAKGDKMSGCNPPPPPPPRHIDTGSGTVHKLILEELIGKYRCCRRKERGKIHEKRKLPSNVLRQYE